MDAWTLAKLKKDLASFLEDPERCRAAGIPETVG
jgi:hypothetical protein